MTDINISRKKIEEIDKQISLLFVQRMDEVKEILEYKRKNNLEITSLERENSLLEKNLKNIKSDTLKKYYIDVFNAFLTVSKKYQQFLLENENGNK